MAPTLVPTAELDVPAPEKKRREERNYGRAGRKREMENRKEMEEKEEEREGSENRI